MIRGGCSLCWGAGWRGRGNSFSLEAPKFSTELPTEVLFIVIISGMQASWLVRTTDSLKSSDKADRGIWLLPVQKLIENDERWNLTALWLLKQSQSCLFQCSRWFVWKYYSISQCSRKCKNKFLHNSSDVFSKHSLIGYIVQFLIILQCRAE